MSSKPRPLLKLLDPAPPSSLIKKRGLDAVRQPNKHFFFCFYHTEALRFTLHGAAGNAHLKVNVCLYLFSRTVFCSFTPKQAPVITCPLICVITLT